MIIISLVVMASCLDEVDLFMPLGVEPGEGDITELLELLQTEPEIRYFNTEVETIIILEKSILTIPPLAFVNASNEVCTGELEIRVRELFDAEGIVRHNVPTITDSHLLESDGVFHIEVYKGDEKLSLKDGQGINIKIENDNSRDKMELFYGKQINDIDFYWEEADADPDDWSNVWQSEWVIQDSGQTVFGFGYEMIVDQLDWINCDIFNEDQPTTTVCVDLPEGFDSRNTRLFMVFDDINSVTVLDPDPDLQMFCTNYSPVPLEYQVTLLALTERDGQYFAIKKNEIITSDLVVQLEPELKTEEEIEDLLNSL